MNEEQRKGLEELSAWKAALRTESSEDQPEQPSPNGEQVVAAAPAAVDVADIDAENATADGEAIEDDVADDDEEEEEEEERAKRRPLVDWLIVMAIALLAAFLIRTYVLAHFVVDGTSMVSTLEDGDRVFVNKLSYRLHDPRRGDVVVLHQLDGTSQRDLIKRVIALPGETIEMRSCDVLIDGRLLQEPYLDPQVVRPGNCGGDLAPVDVPDDHVFVMGDNRAGSQDSRMLGPVDEDELVGRAFVVFWPTSNWRWL